MLLWGWMIALPIPVIVYWAPNWYWVVFATVLLGVNQGLTWSMTQTSKLDLTHANQRGMTIGMNEFAGYFGVAAAGVITGYLPPLLGARMDLLVFGEVTVVLALLLTLRSRLRYRCVGFGPGIDVHRRPRNGLVAVAMFASGLLVLFWGEETHPRLNPAD